MPNQVDAAIKEVRSKKLIELSDKNELEYNKSYIGKDVEVLFEEKDGDFYKGHTKNYMVVKYKTDEMLENAIKVVSVIDANEECLIAE